jgi:nicotinamide mononucleotide transporter
MHHYFGTATATRESALVATLMLIVTLIYEGAMYLLIPDFVVNYYELFGTWCVLTAVWLVRTENIQNWLWGIVGVVLLGVFFGQIGLPGQQWLQWAFFVPVQLWSWYYWANAKRDAERELQVTTMSWLERGLWIVIIILGTVFGEWFIDSVTPGSQYPALDALVVVSSMVAQFLMGRKKVESWVLWLGPVNVVSVVLFFLSGAYVLTALYVAFLVHAYFGLRRWYQVSTRESVL